MVPINGMITFRPDQEINEVIDIIIEKRISGAPVLDENRKLVGIISEKDCLRIIVDQAVIGKQQYTVFGNQECTENGNMNTPVWCK